MVHLNIKNESTQVELSVVMAVFNAGSGLDAAIDSILKQTYTLFEFLIVDDGSTDDTFSRLERFKAKDNRIVIYRLPNNTGLPHALNFGIAKASGNYIARMDADDYSFPSRLETQMSYIEDHPNVSVIGSNAILVDSSGVQLGTSKKLIEHENIVASAFKNPPFIHSSVLFTRDFIETMNGYDENLEKAQDYDLWLRGLNGFTYYNINEPLVRYTIKHKSSLKEDYYGFIVRLKNTFRSKRYFAGSSGLFLYLLVNLLRKFGYKQRLHREPRTTG